MKICYKCEYCFVSLGDQGYGELTPGEPFEMWCQKQHWNFNNLRYSSSDPEVLSKCIERAETCPDFSAAEWVTR
jgi:hypothetical protein